MCVTVASTHLNNGKGRCVGGKVAHRRVVRLNEVPAAEGRCAFTGRR